MPSAKPSTLYYDGQCPLCSFEMRHLNRLKTEDLVLQDIHAQVNLPDASREQYLKVLHLKRSDGSRSIIADTMFAAAPGLRVKPGTGVWMC